MVPLEGRRPLRAGGKQGLEPTHYSTKKLTSGITARVGWSR